MGSMYTIDDLRNKYAEALEDELIHLFDHFHSSLEAIADGRSPELPPMMRASERPRFPRGPRPKRRRRRPTSPSSQTSPSEPSNVIKSSRQKARVDYARMENYSSDDNEDGYEEGIFEQDSDDHGTTTTTAADVARNMMEYQNSPVAIRKRANREVPDASINPPKRTRRTNNSSNNRETSPKLQRPEYLGTYSDLRNNAPKATQRAGPNDQDNSDQRDSQGNESGVLEEQISDLNSNRSEPSRRADLQSDNHDGEEQEAIASQQKHHMARRSGNRGGTLASPRATQKRWGRTYSSPARSLMDGGGKESQGVSQDTVPQRENQQSQQISKYATCGSRRKRTPSEQSAGRISVGTSDRNVEGSTGDLGSNERSRGSRTINRP
ncbi:hypothetical protein BWQ96_02229 [Gracilariopsis chorda]|uniref:Uncharacterized protein n=1 Tax=Gracilariopsis chorda TaxID=448386 RepID=A0A2V3J0Y8_9FLOR|nr:hypothetical protein BWQ96_02229 [Gracilariopsis chorda]|eukprot:PXF48038.1 hypothetical protein BWQ96_02229 [Gracilariopsis chorda]